MIEVVLILVAMLLVLIAIPIVYFLAKKIGHGLKHVFFTAIICVMLTSMIQLGIFYFIMRFRVFVYLCEFGADCNSLFSSFVNISLYSSIAIFALIISVYYLFKFLKGILKWGVIILGIVLIIVAGVLVFNMFMPSTSNTTYIDSHVKDQISKPWPEDLGVVVYLPSSGIASIKQGKEYNLTFLIKNKIEYQNFNWEVNINELNVELKCGINSTLAQEWIISGMNGTLFVDSNSSVNQSVRFLIPKGQIKDSSMCFVRFNIVVKRQDGSIYWVSNFDVKVGEEKKSFWCRYFRIGC